MTKLEQLIKDLCPNGVEYKTLGKLGKFYGGLTGKTKNDFKDGNADFVTYKNIYSNPALSIDIEDKVKINDNEKQNTVQYGDVLFTGSSETPEECGMSSVLTVKTNKKLYLNSFCFGFRFRQLDLFNPDFCKHLFRSYSLRQQLQKTADGVTRFNVSKKKMAKVTIPVPPMAVQNEIVRILDIFTKLTAELTAELTARKKQYEYYRNSLLTFDDSVPMVKLGDLCSILAGGDVPKNYSKEITEEYRVPIYSNGVGEKALYGYTNISKISKSCITVAARGTIGYCALREKPFYPVVRLICVIPKDNLNVRFLKYCVDILTFKVPTTGIPQLTIPMIKEYKIPLPSLKEQQRIVKILDMFEALCNDISVGLPAEIKARKQQYEYYRNKLLTFQEVQA